MGILEFRVGVRVGVREEFEFEFRVLECLELRVWGWEFRVKKCRI